VAARSKAWTVFARSNTGVVGSNRTQGMVVCVRLFCVCVVPCVGSGLTMSWSPVKGVLPCIGLRNWKSGQGPTEECRAIYRQRDEGFRSRDFTVSITTFTFCGKCSGRSSFTGTVNTSSAVVPIRWPTSALTETLHFSYSVCLWACNGR
jgi:hypothetical protein